MKKHDFDASLQGWPCRVCGKLWTDEQRLGMTSCGAAVAKPSSPELSVDDLWKSIVEAAGR